MERRRRGTNDRPLLYTLHARARRSLPQRIADGMTRMFGSAAFFLLHIAFFAGWIVWNIGMIPGLAVFDPYPFGMLTMAVSLEAIFLSIIVLMSQQRAAWIADVREELDFQVNVRAEQEIGEMVSALRRMERRLGTTTPPRTLPRRRGLNLARLERAVVRDVEDGERD